MQDNRFSGYENSVKELVLKFERMLSNRENFFFDVEEFEIIIDYYMETENIEAMENALQYASEIFPRAIPVLLRKAQYYAIENQSERALNLLSEIETIEPENKDLHYIKGTIYSQLSFPENAIEEYNKAIQIGDEALDDIYSNIAFEYENLGKLDKAIEYFKKALETNPENDIFLYDLTSNMDVEQRQPECIEYLEYFIQKHPFSANAWFNLGMCFIRLELYEKAIDALDYALCIDANLTMAYSCKSICFSSMKQSDKAIEVLTEGLENTSDKNHFLFLIAQEYEYQENHEKAIDYYKKVIENDSYFAKAYLDLGVCYDKNDNFDTGYPYLMKAIELEPQNSEFLFTVADILAERQQFEKAAFLFEQCLQLDSDNNEAWIAFADMYADQNLFQESINILERGRTHIVDDLEMVYRLAAYNFLLGKKNNAYLAIHELLEQNLVMASALLEFCPEMGEDINILNIIDSYRLN